MNLNLNNKLFIVPGATSGFGHSILKQLLEEGAKVIGIARTQEKIDELEMQFSENLETICGDISESETIQEIFKKVNGIWVRKHDKVIDKRNIPFLWEKS